eukprot:4381896-Pleurochrysis_carterae.AAC.1
MHIFTFLQVGAGSEIVWRTMQRITVFASAKGAAESSGDAGVAVSSHMSVNAASYKATGAERFVANRVEAGRVETQRRAGATQPLLNRTVA